MARRKLQSGVLALVLLTTAFLVAISYARVHNLRLLRQVNPRRSAKSSAYEKSCVLRTLSAD